MILIGSSAIKYWYPDFPREPKDIDFIVTEKEKQTIEKGHNVEFLENPIFTRMWRYNRSNIPLYTDHLCTLKASHLCWNINWEKHMFDLQFLLKKGNVIEEELFFELYGYWNEYHSKNKRSDLKMSRDEFFDNAVNNNEAEHDFLHTLINPTPTYTKVLKDGAEVELDEEKFKSLTHEQKCEFVREEVMVMAYERYKEMDYRVAYVKMLKKFIISHAPLFSLIFILENYIELQNKPKFNFIKQIENGLSKTK